MKNLLLLSVLLITILCSCAYDEWYINPWAIKLDKDVDKIFIRIANDNQLTLDEKINIIQKYIDFKIEYKKNEAIIRYNIQFPQETLDKKFGDCKSKTVLLIALCYKYLKIKGDMVGGYKSDPCNGHAFMNHKNVYYNSTYPGKIDITEFTVNLNKSFDELPDYINYKNVTWH